MVEFLDIYEEETSTNLMDKLIAKTVEIANGAYSEKENKDIKLKQKTQN